MCNFIDNCLFLTIIDTYKNVFELLLLAQNVSSYSIFTIND